MTELRILTVRNPWAWAIIHGGKDVENRVRNIAGDYRGPVAIHVAQADAETAPDELWREYADHYCARRPQPKIFDPAWSDRGAIICVVDLVDVHHSHEITTDEPIEYVCGSFAGMDQHRRLCSPWAEDASHHLVLENPRPLAEPIPYKGALGLRRLDPIFARAVLNEAAWEGGAC